MNIYLVYKIDNWHSYTSRDTIGVATSQAKAIKICKTLAKKEGYGIDKDQLWNLRNYKQTQGYKGDGEFYFEEVQTNILL